MTARPQLDDRDPQGRSGLADSHGAFVNGCPSAAPSSSPLRGTKGSAP